MPANTNNAIEVARIRRSSGVERRDEQDVPAQEAKRRGIERAAQAPQRRAGHHDGQEQHPQRLVLQRLENSSPASTMPPTSSVASTTQGSQSRVARGAGWERRGTPRPGDRHHMQHEIAGLAHQAAGQGAADHAPPQRRLAAADDQMGGVAGGGDLQHRPHQVRRRPAPPPSRRAGRLGRGRGGGLRGCRAARRAGRSRGRAARPTGAWRSGPPPPPPRRRRSAPARSRRRARDRRSPSAACSRACRDPPAAPPGAGRSRAVRPGCPRGRTPPARAGPPQGDRRGPPSGGCAVRSG